MFKKVSSNYFTIPPKSSIAQRDFLIAKLKRLLANFEKAIDDSNTRFEIDKTIDDLQKTRQDVEISTLFLVDHSTENVTVDSLITDFTALKDFSSECRWFSGLQFLQQSEHRWPLDHSFSEFEKVTMQGAKSSSPLEPILDFETFSD